ncbi:MAG: cyclic nucleotide-binding domain-containing protein [Chloroflexota bacterium]
MADRFVLSHLKRFPLFEHLTPQQLEVVANAVQVLRFQPGEVIFTQSQQTTGAVIFASGRGELTQVGSDRVNRQVGVVEAGEYLNEAALFSDVIAPVTLRAIEVSIALFLGRQQMASLLAYNPDIKTALQGRTATSAPMPVAQNAAPIAAAPAPAFQGKRDNENVLIETRRHWWAFARRIGLTILGIIILLLVGSLAYRAIPSFPWITAELGIFVLVILLWIYFYLEWRNDSLIVTERRVINIQRNLIGLSTNINELPLDAIHEVKVAVPVTDLPARIFGYGTLLIKAAGDGNLMKMDYIPQPKHVQETIFTYRDRVRQNIVDESRTATRNAIRGDIDKFLGRAPDGSITSGDAGTVYPGGAGEHGFLAMKFINEKGETVYRKHRIVWFQHVMLPALMMLVGIILFVVAFVGISPSLGFIGFAIAFVVLAVGAVWFYLADWDWRHDMYIVGDQTITLIHKRPLWLQDENDRILLSQVDNVISEMRGVINTLFKVGDVKLSLTGSDAKNAKWFRNVHEPQEIQQEISRRQDQAAMLKQEAEAERQKQAIIDYLSVYHETIAPESTAQASGTTPNAPGEQPPKVRDRTRPPGIPLVRRDNPPGS